MNRRLDAHRAEAVHRRHLRQVADPTEATDVEFSQAEFDSMTEAISRFDGADESRCLLDPILRIGCRQCLPLHIGGRVCSATL
jgi:hypothetical protein